MDPMPKLAIMAQTALIIVALPALLVGSEGCPFILERALQVTTASGASQTARGNERDVWVDAKGTVHLVWEDNRDGNFMVYYATVTGDSIGPQMRLSKSTGESTFPCITGESDDVYILWQETISKTTQIMYCRLSGGKEALRAQLTKSEVGAFCPVSTVGPDKVLHVAWFQGSGNFSTVYYGKIVADSLVEKVNVSSKHPGGFRPDIARDPSGRILLAWYQGLDVESRLWNGSSWEDEVTISTNNNRSWRLSVASIADGKWALAWFDQARQSTDVRAAFFDGKTWSAPVRVNTGQTGFYPSAVCFGPGKLMVVWEDQDKTRGEYMLMMRCWDRGSWGNPGEIVRGRSMSRYASLFPWGGSVHAIWFGPLGGNNEIYYGVMRGK